MQYSFLAGVHNRGFGIRYATDFPLMAWVLPSTIYTLYMAATSLPYMMHLQGYTFFEKDYGVVPTYREQLLAAEAQGLYYLAHWSVLLGMLVFRQTPSIRYAIRLPNFTLFALRFAFIASLLSIAFRFIPGLSQFVQVFGHLSSVSGIMTLAYSILQHQHRYLLPSLALYVYNLYLALVSGWKEAILIPIVLLGMYLYPKYKATTSVLGAIFLFAYFYFVPTYNLIVRNLSWSGDVSSTAAAYIAYESLLEGNEDVKANNWAFLTFRVSEISMFVKYLESCPDIVPYYGWQIPLQSLQSIIPRIFYPGKPITEQQVMSRVIDNGVVSSQSQVSAKPQLAVDGYLTAGWVGVFLVMFVFGLSYAWVCIQCYSLFGGYTFGVGLICTGLFQFMWRGNCMEFLANSFVWSTVTMYILFYVFRKMGILTKAS